MFLRKYHNETKWFWICLIIGVFIILNNLIWIVINGGRWFEPIPPNGKPLYFNDLHRVFGPAYMLFYFTIQTNLFLAIMFIFLAFYFNSVKTQSLFVGSNVLITITFIIYWSAIAPFNDDYEWKSVYYQFYNIFVHVINPMLGFVCLIILAKRIYVNKRILGYVFYYIPIFLVLNAILYGVGVVIEDGQLNGASVYAFLDLQNLIFLNLSSMPALAWFLYIFLIVLSPSLGIILSFCWTKILRILPISEINSYYKWMERIKKHYRYDFKKI